MRVRAIDFYKQAFGATEILRMAEPDSGVIGHAEIKIGNSPIMLADEHPAIGFVGPKTLEGSTVSICLYIEDVDSLFKRAIQAGANSNRFELIVFYHSLFIPIIINFRILSNRAPLGKLY